MTLAAWRRRMALAGGTLLVLGAVLMIGGGLYAGMQQDTTALRGIWVASGGTLGTAVGGVLLKVALFGPVPAAYAAEWQDQEVSD